MSKELRGGLNSSNTPIAASIPDEKWTSLDAAICKMTYVKNSGKKLSLFSSRPKAAETTEGVLDRKDLSIHVNSLADMAYEFMINTALPYFWEMQRDIADIGEEVLLEPKYSEVTRREYESAVSDLRQFCPENDPDGILNEEASSEGRRPFVEALCLRVRHCAEIANLVFELRHAADKDDVVRVISNASEGLNSKKRVFTGSSEKTPIRAFGQHYSLAENVFGRYHNFAQEKLAEAIRQRSRELAEARKEELEQKKQEVSAQDDSLVSPEELLFCDTAEVSEKTALLSWKFEKNENILKLRRVGDRLYVVGVAGSTLTKYLEEMRDETGEKDPFILLKHILTQDRGYLCPEEAEGKYRFNGFVKTGFNMTRWVRIAAGKCIQHRLLPAELEKKALKANGSDRKRPAKALGELLNEEEFFYHHGLGNYNLTFPVGFCHRIHDETRKPTSEVVTLAEPASARIRREEVQGKDCIFLESTSSRELAKLLEKAGIQPYGEDQHGLIMFNDQFHDGPGWKYLPVPLANGLKLAFGRLKASKGGVS